MVGANITNGEPPESSARMPWPTPLELNVVVAEMSEVRFALWSVVRRPVRNDAFCDCAKTTGAAARSAAERIADFIVYRV